MKEASWASSERARNAMRGNRSRDTKPERAVRALVFAKGLRYRTHVRPEPNIPRSADLVFKGPHIAVFIDGCFWHLCPQHCRIPVSNASYWTAKLEGNRARDLETTETLERLGWRVLRFWAHVPPDEVAVKIEQAVRGKSVATTDATQPTGSVSVPGEHHI